VILAAGIWVYWPVLRGDWLWDDDFLITDNHLVHDPWGLWKIWFKPGDLYDYTPLTVTVEWLEWHLWEMQTLGYHLVNVALHLTSAFLIWRLLTKFGLKLAWLGGLIFVVHPVAVESVAWISEIKNTLSLPPFLLAMLAYIDFEASGKAKKYWLALGLFLTAMLCKATMVMFPLVILFYAWWRRGRIGLSDLKASTPFFAVSLAIGLTTTWFLQHHAMGRETPQLGGPLERLACAGLSLAFYFSKCVLPMGLSPIYPKWELNPPGLLDFLPWPVLVGALAWLWVRRAGWGRHALLGVGFFAINLLPFLGFTPGSYMIFTWVMDHILYIPLIGLIGLFVAGAGQLRGLIPPIARQVGAGILAIVLVVLAWGSHAYAKDFRDQGALWSRTLAVNPASWLAESNIGNALYHRGHIDEAMEHYARSIRIKPSNPDPYYNIGDVLFHGGQPAEAVKAYRKAIEVRPDYVPAYSNLGVALVAMGKLDEGVAEYRAALKIDPENTGAMSNLGVVLTEQAKFDEAEEVLRKAVEVDPYNFDATYNLGNTLFRMGRIPEAKAEYEAALKMKPDDSSVHNNLGAALEHMGMIPEAASQFEAAVQLDPTNANAQANLARMQAVPK